MFQIPLFPLRFLVHTSPSNFFYTCIHLLYFTLRFYGINFMFSFRPSEKGYPGARNNLFKTRHSIGVCSFRSQIRQRGKVCVWYQYYYFYSCYHYRDYRLSKPGNGIRSVTRLPCRVN